MRSYSVVGSPCSDGNNTKFFVLYGCFVVTTHRIPNSDGCLRNFAVNLSIIYKAFDISSLRCFVAHCLKCFQNGNGSGFFSYFFAFFRIFSALAVATGIIAYRSVSGRLKRPKKSTLYAFERSKHSPKAVSNPCEKG